MPSLITALRMAPWVAILVLLLLLGIVDRRADKWEAHAGKLSAELNRISTAKDEQGKKTSVNIAEAEKGTNEKETKNVASATAKVEEKAAARNGAANAAPNAANVRLARWTVFCVCLLLTIMCVYL